MMRQRLWAFLFPPDSDCWGTLLRIGLGLQLTFFAWSVRVDWNDLFRTNGPGLVNRALTALASGDLPAALARLDAAAPNFQRLNAPIRSGVGRLHLFSSSNSPCKSSHLVLKGNGSVRPGYAAEAATASETLIVSVLSVAPTRKSPARSE